MWKSFKPLAGPLFAFSVAASSASASAATLFDEVGDSETIKFNGFAPEDGIPVSGLTSELVLTLNEISGLVMRFSYVLTNTSTNAHPDSRVSSFAFSSDPDVVGASATGGYTRVETNGTLPGNTAFEVCFTNQSGNSPSNCNSGPGGTGALIGSPASGTLELTFGSNATSVVLSDFLVRYQSTEADGEGSQIGTGTVMTPIPEPATWLMMILGVFGIGYVMRKRQAGASAFA